MGAARRTDAGERLGLHHPADPAKMATAVDPVAGQAFTVPADVPTDRLVQLAYDLRVVDANHRVWRQAVDRELSARMMRADKRDATVAGYRLRLRYDRRQHWDSADRLDIEPA